MNKEAAVLFSYNNGLLSRLIRWVSRERFSHVAILIDNSIVLDARFPGGVKQRYLNYKPQEILWMELDMDKAKSCIGSKYDLKKFFWYAFRVGKPWNTPTQFLCSEVIAYASGDPNMYDMTPDEIYYYELSKTKGENAY
ncbi:hypothetical protein [Halobacillus andaensis]|uniref:hypothetical protein n=1 Tax=Halobacillus andaensis TaxID=1176239 RepID=UPI003D7324BF